MKRIVSVVAMLSACAPLAGLDVEPADKYFGAELDGGGVITGIAQTIRVRRTIGAPFTDQDFPEAFEAAQAYCAGRDEKTLGDGTDDLADLPSFFDGEWEVAAECVPQSYPL